MARRLQIQSPGRGIGIQLLQLAIEARANKHMSPSQTHFSLVFLVNEKRVSIHESSPQQRKGRKTCNSIRIFLLNCSPSPIIPHAEQPIDHSLTTKEHHQSHKYFLSDLFPHLSITYQSILNEPPFPNTDSIIHTLTHPFTKQSNKTLTLSNPLSLPFFLLLTPS